MNDNALEKYLRDTLLDARGEAKLSQEKMAEQLNISPRAMSNLECGNNTFGLQSFLRFYLKFLIDQKAKETFWKDVEQLIEEQDRMA